MSLASNLKERGKYKILVTCENCGKHCDLLVKKGITVEQFSEDNMAICDNCGCVIEFQEYKTKWLE